MHKKHTTKEAKDSQKVPLSVHKAVNWAVSVVLVVFAIWSITLNAEGRSLFKQATQMIAEIDKKLEKVKTDLQVVQTACQKTTIVVPTTTTDNQ